jgi:hypothetical protein
VAGLTAKPARTRSGPAPRAAQAPASDAPAEPGLPEEPQGDAGSPNGDEVSPAEPGLPEEPQGDAGSPNGGEQPAAVSHWRVTSHVARWRAARKWSVGEVATFALGELSDTAVESIQADPGFTIDTIKEGA